MPLDRRRGARGLVVATGVMAAGLLSTAGPATATAAGSATTARHAGTVAFACDSGSVRYVLGLAEIDAQGCVRVHGSGPHWATPVPDEQEARISLPGPSRLARVLYTCASYDVHGAGVSGFTCRATGFEADLDGF